MQFYVPPASPVPVKEIMNTTGLFVIVADALTNGISFPPSSTINFPDITISDMVDSQYQLVTNHLGIDHLHAAGLHYHREYEMDIMYKKERIGGRRVDFFCRKVHYGGVKGIN